ncbi:MAG: hypothetical protein ABIG64_07475 [Candidatus Omnitrophota bacterium]
MKKQTTFILVTVIITYLIIEMFTGIVLYFISERKFWWDFALNNKTQLIPEKLAKEDIVLPPWLVRNDEKQLIHPYLGFINNPAQMESTRFGFTDNKSPLQKKSQGKIIVGIFGGSAAEIFAQFGKQALKEQLQKYPKFTGKEIVVLNLAIGGYKQPQQLIALNYILALGGEFDIVISLDGFNEVVLPVIDNLPHGVNPFFPCRWDLKVKSDVITEKEIVLLSEIIRLKQLKKKLADFYAKGLLRYSPTVCLIVQRLYINAEINTAKKRTALFDLPRVAENKSVVACGPEFSYETNQELFKELTSVWIKGSVFMHNLCKNNGIEYFHFLQPCQYLPEAKIMTDAERKIAFNEKARHRQAVIDGYPYLIKAVEQLKQKGIISQDLTKVFLDHPEPIYIDDFCHFGQAGSQIIADVVAKTIIQKLEKQYSD